jgi:hypothetical protein
VLESAEIDERFPRWAFRVYRFHNHGVLYLLRGDPDRAESEFRRAVTLSLEMGLWPISVVALAGTALCALRRSEVVVVHSICEQLESRLRGRRRVLHDRWMVEAALSWDNLIRLGDVSQTMHTLAPIRAELQRRDIDSWLRLELQALLQQERSTGEREPSMRRRLLEQCRKYSAAAIEREIAG